MRNVDEVLLGYYLDVDNDDVCEIQFTNNLSEMKRLVNAKTVSILSAKIGGKPVRVICAGDARDSVIPAQGDAIRKVSALGEDNCVLLHGNLLILASHMEGEDEVFHSMDPMLMSHIKDRVALVDIGQGPKKYNTYVMCDMELKS